MEVTDLDRRAASPVVGVILVVAIVVILAAVVGLFVLAYDTPSPAPEVAIETATGTDGGNDWVRFTHAGGESIVAEKLAVVSSKPVDFHSDRGSICTNVACLSGRERFDEGGQFSGGDTWDAGESVHVGGNGDLSGETLYVVWSENEFRGSNPAELDAETTYILLKYTPGE